MLTIHKNKQNDTLTLSMEGQIDTNTAPQLAEEVNATPQDVTHLIMDLTEVDYVSSAGLRVFLTAEGLMADKGDFILKNVNENVMDVLDMTGFSDILTIQNDN